MCSILGCQFSCIIDDNAIELPLASLTKSDTPGMNDR
jgi:hypothetical protein